MSNASIASRIELLKTESAFKILARANELETSGRNIIHCEIGQPDFKTPDNIIKAGCDAMNSGFTGYTPSPGYIGLREAIAEFYTLNKNVPTEAEDVVVVPGGKPVMFFTMQMLVEPGDEVIYPDPGFPIYHSCIAYSGGVPVPVPLKAEDDFKFDLEVFRKSITPKTKLVVINSPSNPTGGVFSREDIDAIADILRDHPDIYILSDEIYDRLVYEGSTAPSIAAVPGFKDRTIILNGFSKAYAMTGWRLGYGIMNRELARAMELLMVNSNSCAASFTQIAAIEALKGPQDSVEYMRNAFLERRDWLINALNSIPGISCCMPKGAFYAFPDISSFGLSCHEFCDRLLDEGGVAASWGSSFGENGEGHIRLSYANSLENLKTAVDRLYIFTRGLR